MIIMITSYTSLQKYRIIEIVNMVIGLMVRVFQMEEKQPVHNEL